MQLQRLPRVLKEFLKYCRVGKKGREGGREGWRRGEEEGMREGGMEREMERKKINPGRGDSGPMCGLGLCIG